MPDTKELRGVPLLREVLKTIDEKPGEWNQGTWGTRSECGTAMCVAGWACVLAGFPLKFEAYGPYGQMYADKTVSGEHVSEKAAELMDIDGDTTDDLFASLNNRADIQEIAERIAADAGETL